MGSEGGKKGLLVFFGLVGVMGLLVKNPYHLFILNIVALNAIVVLGLNLLMGLAGQISLGHAAFFGLGAYFSAVLTVTYNISPLWAIVLAVVFTGLAAWIVGIPTMRLEGNYLIMATLGLNVIVHLVMVRWEQVTGGPPGISGVPYIGLLSFRLDSDLRFFWFIWPLLGLFIWLAHNITFSMSGLNLKALHENETATSSLGVNTASLKVKVFVLSAVFACLAGSLYAHYTTFVSPSTGSIFYSIEIVTMVVVGGVGHIWGGVLGAAVLTLLPELLHVVKDFSTLVYGAILTLSLVFFPEGLFPGVLRAITGKRGTP